MPRSLPVTGMYNQYQANDRHRRWSGYRDCSQGRSDEWWPDGRYQATVALAQRLLQFFRHHPECPVELNVAVYAFNRAGVAALAFGSTSLQTTFQQVFLATIKN